MTLDQKIAIYQVIGSLHGIASTLPSQGVDLKKVSEALERLADVLSYTVDQTVESVP